MHVRSELGHEDVEAGLSAFPGFKLEGVVVIGELDARLLGERGGLVGMGRDLLVVVEGLAVLVGKVGDDKMAQTDLAGLLEDPLEVGIAVILGIHDGVPLEVGGVQRQARTPSRRR